MKEFIEALINQKEEFSPEQILDAFFKIGVERDIIILKNDGIRDTDKLTIVITSGDNSFDSIRYDGDSLSEIFRAALQGYILNKIW